MKVLGVEECVKFDGNWITMVNYVALHQPGNKLIKTLQDWKVIPTSGKGML